MSSASSRPGHGFEGSSEISSLTVAPVARLAMAGNRLITTAPVLMPPGKLMPWPSPVLDSAWHWVEMFYTPSVSVDLSKDLVAVSHNTTNAPGALLFDGSSVIGIGCRPGAGLANTDVTDWAAVYYAPGIPTLANRVKLANRRNPTGVPYAG